jgi:8-oxo-dGTP pyrophosphatase MutT (NUDIX family)
VQTLSSRQVYANNWMTVREDAVRRPDGTDGIFGVVDKPTYALVIPRDGDRLHLVEQFRYAVGRRRWEFPAGTAPDRAEVDPADLAVQELVEETGLRAGRMELIGHLDVAPGMSSQTGTVWLATELTAGPTRRETTEADMRAAWFTAAEFEAMARTGEITDSQSLAAYLLLTLHDGARAGGTGPERGGPAQAEPQPGGPAQG